MLERRPNKKKSRNTLISGLFVAAAGLTQTAAADPHRYATAPNPIAPDPINSEFRASHPVKIFVDVSQDRRVRSVRRSRTDSADQYVRDRLHYQLPPYIVLVSNRHDANMTVKAQLMDYDLSFHTTDVDRRNKKYKKRYRYTGGVCGQHKRAYYTRVTEKGVALADYKLSVRLKGIDRYSDTVRIRAAESYRYGEKLSALTNCGVVPSVHYPNKTIAKLFTRAGGTYRNAVAHDVRKESLKKLTYILAGTIKGRTDQFYAALANQYADRAYARTRHVDTHHPRNADAEVHDYDGVDADSYWRKKRSKW